MPLPIGHKDRVKKKEYVLWLISLLVTVYCANSHAVDAALEEHFLQERHFWLTYTKRKE